MSKEFNKTVKTMKAAVMYAYITGEGRDTAMPGEAPNMQYVISVLMKKDSPEHKAILADINAVWIPYKEKKGLKGAPDTNGIKPIMKASDELDEYGDPKEIETDEVLVTFKTKTKWPDGKDKKVQILQPNGADCTEVVRNATWTIGNGSICIVHGVASPNNTGGKDKVSLYLQGVQFAGELIKYTGTSIEAEEVEGVDSIDLGEEGTVDVSNDTAEAPSGEGVNL